MLEEVLNTYQKIYKKKQNNIPSLENNFDYDKDTEFLLNQITPNSSFLIPDKKETKKKKNNNISQPKQKPQNHKHKHKHQHGDCSSCIECHPYFRMLKKQRKKLVDFINNSQIKNLKLIGNNRYKDRSPKKYIHDNDRKLPNSKMGIIPIPLNKKKKNLSALEKEDYHELQRSIVMMRRIQYDRKIRKGALSNYLDEVIFIQRWWRDYKKLEKIKKIQKYFREFLNRKKLKLFNKLKDDFERIENIINKKIFKKYFDKIKLCKYKKKPIVNESIITKNNINRNNNIKISYINNYCYMSKKRNILSISSLNKLNDIQNNYRIFKAIQKKNKLLLMKKFRPINKKHNLFNKITVNENLLNEKMNMLQRNIRYFLYENKRKKVIKINREKEVEFGFYIDKITLNIYILKIIEFNKKLRHAMQKISLKKRTKYKNIKDYNIDDINKISKIQNIYKSHYNKYNMNRKDLIKIYSNKSTINCFISKTRKQKYNKVLVLMQKVLKTKLQKIRFEKNIIKNKPKSIDFNRASNHIVSPTQKIQNQNLGLINNKAKKNRSFSVCYMGNDSITGNKNYNLLKKLTIDGISHNENEILGNKDKNKLKENNIYGISFNNNIHIRSSQELNKNNVNYNLVSLITKKRIINVKNELILLQRAIKSFLIIKKTKSDYYNNKNCLFINKFNINKNFYITKEHTNEKEYIDKIIYLQTFYKNRFNYFKNNIIKFTISTEREEQYLRLPEKIIHGFTINGNNKKDNNNIYNINNLINDNQNEINIPANNNSIKMNTVQTNSFSIDNNSKINKLNKKLRRSSLQMERNKITLLSYLVERNRKPVQQIIGNYYEKIRVNSKIYEKFIKSKNKCFYLFNKLNGGLYISKTRYVDNNEHIKLIQNKFRDRQKLRKIEERKNIIFQKPLNQNYIIVNEKINKDRNEKRKGKIKSKYNFNQDSSDENEKLNNIKSYYSSKDSNENEEDEDSYFEGNDRDLTDIVGEKIYTIYNKNKIIRQPHLNMNNYYYISKIRMYNEKEDASSQKEYDSIKKELKERRLNNKNKYNEIQSKFSPNGPHSPSQKSNYSSESNSSSPKKIKNKIIKNGKEKKFGKENNILSNKKEEKKEKTRMKLIKNSNCYIEKIRFKNNKVLKMIKNYIKKNEKNKSNKKNNYVLNITYLKPINDRCYISKYIKNKYRKNKIILDNNKLRGSRNNDSLLKDIKINNTLKKMKIIDQNNFKNNNINNINNFNNSSNNATNNNKINNDINSFNSNVKDIKNIQINNEDCNSNKLENESNYNSYSEKSNGNNIISHDCNGNYIIKNKRVFNNININNKIKYFHNKINYINFIHLLNLFLIKNTQEYIFYKLLIYSNNRTKNKCNCINIYNNSKFSFPFYISCLKRVFKYISKENKYNKRIKSFLYLIFPSLNKNKSFYYHLLCLTFENRKKLINTNLYNLNIEKNILIELFDDFSNFDKKISNKKFIINKINKTVFFNTNIFTLIKFIDIEYYKLKKGFYCENCYQLENICSCVNKKFNNYFSNGSDEDLYYLDLNGNTESKSGKISVNYFIDEKDKDEYFEKIKNLKKNQIICIKKKPKMGLDTKIIFIDS